MYTAAHTEYFVTEIFWEDKQPLTILRLVMHIIFMMCLIFVLALLSKNNLQNTTLHNIHVGLINFVHLTLQSIP